MKRAIYDMYGERGLESGWELGTYLTTADDIRAEYERAQRRRAEQRILQQSNAKGVFTLSLDATGLFEGRDGDDAAADIEVAGISLSQTIEAPLSETDVVTCAGALLTMNGTGTGSVTAAVKRQFSTSSSVELSGTLGNGGHVSVLGTTQLTRHSFGSLALTATQVPVGALLGVTALLARQLTPRTMGYLTWKAGLESCMAASVVRHGEAGTLTAVVQFGVPRSFVAATYVHRLDGSSRVRISAKAGTTGLSVEYGADRAFGENHRLGVWLHAGFPSGVVLKVKATRVYQSVLLPIQLSADLSLRAVLYGTLVPALLCYAAQRLILAPLARRREREYVCLSAAHHTALHRRTLTRPPRLLLLLLLRARQEAAANAPGQCRAHGRGAPRGRGGRPPHARDGSAEARDGKRLQRARHRAGLVRQAGRAVGRCCGHARSAGRRCRR